MSELAKVLARFRREAQGRTGVDIPPNSTDYRYARYIATDVPEVLDALQSDGIVRYWTAGIAPLLGDDNV